MLSLIVSSAFCAGFAIFGIVLFVNEVKFLMHSAKTVGTVRKIEKEVSSRRVVHYYPIVMFNVDGNTIRFRSPVSTTRKKSFTVGDQVKVLYDKRDPNNAQINKFIFKWGYCAVMFFFAAFLSMAVMNNYHDYVKSL